MPLQELRVNWPYHHNLQMKSSTADHKLQFSFSFHDPVTENLLHSLPARPAANIDRRDDLEGLDPLDKSFQFQEAAVFAVRDSCQRRNKDYHPILAS